MTGQKFHIVQFTMVIKSRIWILTLIFFVAEVILKLGLWIEAASSSSIQNVSCSAFSFMCYNTAAAWWQLGLGTISHFFRVLFCQHCQPFHPVNSEQTHHAALSHCAISTHFLARTPSSFCSLLSSHDLTIASFSRSHFDISLHPAKTNPTPPNAVHSEKAGCSFL